MVIFVMSWLILPCTKTKNMQELCSFDQRYFDLWEMGEGPMQNLEENKINTQEMIAQEDKDMTISKEKIKNIFRVSLL